MRLYCPTCREDFEEPQDRYDRLSGRVPCRVCRTTLEKPRAGGGGGAAPEMLSQVFTVGDDGKTTMLTMEDFGLSAGKTTILETPSEDALRSMGLLPGGGGAPPPGPAPQSSRPSGPVAPPNFGPPPGGNRASGPVAPPNFGPAPGPAPMGSPYGGSQPYGSAPGPGPAPMGSPYGGSQPSPYGGGAPSPYGGSSASPYGGGAPSPYGGGAPSGPVAAPNFGPPPVASPSGPVQAYGGQAQRPPTGQPAQFHSNPTYIFPQQDPAAGPPPGAPPGFQARMPSQPAAPGGGDFKTGPTPAASAGADGRAKHKKKVVIGGAAADQKTQMFNAADFAMIASQNSSQEMAPLQAFDQPPPPGPAPMGAAGAGRGHKPVVVEVPGAAAPPPPGMHVQDNTAMVARGEKRGGGLKIVLIVLVVLGLIGGGVVLVLDYLRSDPGDSTPAPGDAAAGGADPGAPQVSATRLLQNLRDTDYVRPPFVSGGAQPAERALVLGAMPNSTGDTYYWLSTPTSPTPTEVTGGLAGALTPSELPLYVVFDGASPPVLVIETLAAARTAGLAPWLVAGSPMGTDIHYVYDATATAATTRIRLGASTIAIHSAGWAEPRVICYGSTLPLREVRAVLDEIFGTAGVNASPVAVGVDLADGVELQKLFILLEGLERAGLQVQLGLSGAPPPACPP